MSENNTTWQKPLRSTTSPNPIYGFPPGWSIADLPTSYSGATVALTTVSTDTTSSTQKTGGNGIVLQASFSDATTTCSIDVTDSTTSTLLKTFKNVSLSNADNLYLTYNDMHLLLQGDSITVRAYNFTGSGSVTIAVGPNN